MRHIPIPAIIISRSVAVLQSLHPMVEKPGHEVQLKLFAGFFWQSWISCKNRAHEEWIVNRVINSSTPVGSSGIGSYSWLINSSQTPATDYKVRVQARPMRHIPIPAIIISRQRRYCSHFTQWWREPGHEVQLNYSLDLFWQSWISCKNRAHEEWDCKSSDQFKYSSRQQWYWLLQLANQLVSNSGNGL